jgi:hypothetical protein
VNPQVYSGAAIIGKALVKDCNLRYQGAADMRADLERLKRGAEIGRLVSVTSGPVATSRAKGKKTRWAVVTPVVGRWRLRFSPRAFITALASEYTVWNRPKRNRWVRCGLDRRSGGDLDRPPLFFESMTPFFIRKGLEGFPRLVLGRTPAANQQSDRSAIQERSGIGQFGCGFHQSTVNSAGRRISSVISSSTATFISWLKGKKVFAEVHWRL